MGLYITQCYREANALTKLALILLTAALYLGWYGYCTVSWGRVFPTADSDYYIGYGVWRIADSQSQRRNTSSGSLPPLPVVLYSTVGWLLGVCWLVAVIVFGVQFDDTYDIYPYDDPTLQYSFYLAVVVVALQLTAGIVLLINTRGRSGGSGDGGGGVAENSNNA